MPNPSNTPAGDLAAILLRAAALEQPVPCSVEMLSELSGLTVRVLQRRCQAVGVHARECLRFVQCWRLLTAGDSLHESLPVRDPRTMKAILSAASVATGAKPSMRDFVERQQFLTNASLIAALLASAPDGVAGPEPARSAIN